MISPTFRIAGDINTNLSLRAGGEIDASTSGRGNGGEITVNSIDLDLTKGSNISAQSTGTGIAGNIIIPEAPRETTDTEMEKRRPDYRTHRSLSSGEWTTHSESGVWNMIVY
ncbi:MAG: hypothetical protein AB4368_28090 [Xenococcaceae cyanobacterium]